MSAERSIDATRERRIRRRHVFYIAGFDPRGPAPYYQIYSDHAKRQSAVNGIRISVGPRRNVATHAACWKVDSNDDGIEISTCYEFLRWDDIVRLHWPKSAWQQLVETFRTTWHYWRSGTTSLIYSYYPRTAFVLNAPAVLLTSLALIILISSGTALWWLNTSSVIVSLLLWATSISLLALLARRIERQMQFAWLMRSYSFTSKYAAGNAPELDERIEAFGSRIAEIVIAGATDEVLVVGHSSGSFVAVAVIANTETKLVATDVPPAVEYALLTLGDCTPMLSMLPEANKFRSELSRTRSLRQWTWLDFSAPADGCSFIASSPRAPRETHTAVSNDDRPRYLSPRFAKMFSPVNYKLKLADKMAYHFQYLMSTELLGAYDYFAITAGSHSLARRFGVPADDEPHAQV